MGTRRRNDCFRWSSKELMHGSDQKAVSFRNSGPHQTKAQRTTASQAWRPPGSRKTSTRRTSTHNTSSHKTAKRAAPKRWSQRVTKQSDALDLKQGVSA